MVIEVATEALKWYRIAPGWIFVALIPLAVSAGAAIALPGFLRFWPAELAIAFVGLGISIVLLAIRPWVTLSVGLGRRTVIIKGILRRVKLTSDDVKEVVIDPPIQVESMTVDWWGKKTGEIDSICRIRTVDGREVRLTLMPNGLKVRVARILDPEHHAPDDSTQEHRLDRIQTPRGWDQSMSSGNDAAESERPGSG